MTIKLTVLTRSALDTNALIDHVRHANDIDPHGSARFDLKDTGHNITAHATGSGFNYLFDIPISGSVRQIIVDKGSAHLLDVDFLPALKVSTLLSPSKFAAFFKNQAMTFNGNDGNDTFESGYGIDYLKGGKGNDNLDGNRGNDRIEGSLGNDTLSGDDGDDWLIGGTGRDFLAGGNGRDRFDFNSITESRVGSQHDTIKEFHHSQGDRIDLGGLDANNTLVGNQAFSFIGSAAFSNTAGELRYSGGLLQGDING